MTKEILQQYSALLKERDEISASIERLEKQIAKMSDDGTVKDSVKGGYGGIQRFVIEGYPNDEISRRRGLLRFRKEQLERLEKRILESINEIEVFLHEVDDSRIRLIIRLRYVNNLRWEEVARQMGGGNTEDTVKKMFYRYLERENSSDIEDN